MGREGGSKREREQEEEKDGKVKGRCWREAYFLSTVIPRYHEQQIKRSFSKDFDKKISLGI